MREFHSIAYLLNIRTLSMKLDQSDWRIVSKVMLHLVTQSIDSKSSDTVVPYIAQIRDNIGTLTE